MAPAQRYTCGPHLYSPLSPIHNSLTHSLFHSRLKPTSFTDLTHHRLSSGRRIDCTDFMTGPFLLSLSFFWATVTSNPMLRDRYPDIPSVCLCAMFWGIGIRWVFIEHNVAWAKAYLRTKWHLDQSSRLVTSDMDRKLGGGTGGAGSPSNKIWPGPRHTSIPSGILVHPAVWHNTWPKSGGAAPPFGGNGSSSNIISPEPRPTSMPSFILIRSTVWPQYTNVTSRQDRQTGQCPIA